MTLLDRSRRKDKTSVAMVMKPYPIGEVSAIVGRMQTGIFDSLKESSHRQHPSPLSKYRQSREPKEREGSSKMVPRLLAGSPYLDAAAQNHSTRNLRLWLKRFWNCLNYSRSMRLSGTPSDTTIVL